MKQLSSVVDFEMAELLKEKGFNEKCRYYYDERGYCAFIESGLGYYRNEYNRSNSEWKPSLNISAPTIAETIDWIYDKHGIWILVDWMTRIKPYNSGFYSHLRGTNKPLNQDNFISINNTKSPGYEVFNSPKEAYIEAIKYVLNNLIK